MYKAKVNASYEFDVTEEAVDQLDAVETSTNKYHILQNNSSIKANIVSSAQISTKKHTVLKLITTLMMLH